MRPRHVYIHVPFCARRCTYCDFSIAVRSRPPADEYLSALHSELQLRYASAEPWEVDTLYLGGGTPSSLGVDVARIVSMFEPSHDAEVTLEANPENVTAANVAAWREAGINRISLGAQSFDARVLSWMHRTHRVDDISRAVDVARRGGVTNISLDLIFALPTRLERDWVDDVNRALTLRPAHLSLYGLTVEPKTPLGRWVARGQTVPADDAVYAEEFLRAHNVATATGYEHYEVSNFALPNQRARHNSAYWSGAAYAGLGPSAHEFDGTTRRWNVSPYAAWRKALADGVNPVEGSEQLTRENRETERVYLGLRTTDGLVTQPGDDRVISSWIDQGWVSRKADRAVMTPTGWLRLDTLAADLTYARSRSYF